jgi:hypothetical protein
MSSDEHRIMEVVADDAPDKASPEDVEAVLKELRQFVNEHDSSPSRRDFRDWSEHHSRTIYENHFGSWNSAVEVVGGDHNYQHNRTPKEEALQALDEAAEQRIEYKVDGENKVSPKGEAPPSSELQYIDSVDNLLSPDAYTKKFDPTYTELAIERGHDTAATPRIPKEKALQALDEAAEQRIEYKVDGEEKVSPEGEAPMSQHLQHIDSVDNLLSRASYSRKFEGTYTELAIERGHDTVATSSAPESSVERSEYDWDKVNEKLKQAIDQEVYCRALDEYSPPGEIPPDRYVDNHEDLPASDTVHGRHDNLKQDLGLDEERNANDVNVDPTDFGL